MSEEATESGLPPEVEARLKEQGVDYIVIKTKAGVCAFRSLKRPEYQRWQAMVADPKARDRAGEQVCSFTVLHPPLATFQGYLEKYPGILHKCSEEVLSLSGFDADAETKKFESV